ncbi:MAG: TrkA family potassium uptake protein [Methanolobus sp.]|nr:TrkA family potassium uptake protein [Methanolobus sp.]
MRLVIVGATALGQNLAEDLIPRGHEIIYIERDTAIANEIAETLDCTVINAEGTRPDILEKAGIDKADAVIACTDNDQNNILIGLIAREANVGKVIIVTDDKQFMEVAKKLGFYYIMNPSNISSEIIFDVLRGVNTMELSSLIRSDVRFMSVIIKGNFDGVKMSEISLPEESAFIGLYRNNDFLLAKKEPRLMEDDELIIVTRSDLIRDINKLFRPDI